MRKDDYAEDADLYRKSSERIIDEIKKWWVLHPDFVPQVVVSDVNNETAEIRFVNKEEHMASDCKQGIAYWPPHYGGAYIPDNRGNPNWLWQSNLPDNPPWKWYVPEIRVTPNTSIHIVDVKEPAVEKLSVAEVREKRDLLESRLLQELQDFELSTGTRINEIHVSERRAAREPASVLTSITIDIGI